VLTCSGLTGEGLPEVWQAVTDHRVALDAAGELATKRQGQQVRWMWQMVRDRLLAELIEAEPVRTLTPELERQVREGSLAATLAAEQLLTAFRP
jgi:LAO/AO transport system kinase